MLSIFAFCALIAGKPPAVRLPEAPSPRVKSENLPANHEKAVRKALSDNIKTGTQFDGPLAFVEVVAVPDSLVEAHSQHPAATIAYLLDIAETAEPVESMKAVAYILSLKRSPVVGVVVVRNFEKSSYDTLNTSWGMSPRQHWLSKAKQESSSKK